jgi:hypothetical protein
MLLQAQPDGSPDLAAATLCGGSDPAAETRSGGIADTTSPHMINCGVVPLFPSEQARCPDRFSTAGGTPCQYPGDNFGRTITWTFTLDPSPARFKVLTVYVGGDRVRPVLRATDAAAPWAAVVVCPQDITGDGLTDLVVTFRETRAPAKLLVEAVDLHAAPKTVFGLEPAEESDAQGEGCLSPLVEGLRLDDGKLTVVANPPPPPGPDL